MYIIFCSKPCGNITKLNLLLKRNSIGKIKCKFLLFTPQIVFLAKQNVLKIRLSYRPLHSHCQAYAKHLTCKYIYTCAQHKNFIQFLFSTFFIFKIILRKNELLKF